MEAEVGRTAPDFELLGTMDGDQRMYRLSDYTDDGEWVLLAFYAFDFNPICTEGMCSLRDAEFFELYDDLAVLGVSGDGIHSHEEFAQQHNINYPLLSDTAKDVAEKYGVLNQEYNGMRRVHQRAIYLIDPSRTIRLSAEIQADSPDDIQLSPINEALRQLIT